MNNKLFEKTYNPDVLNCLANLSNDEVFTPPEIVNQMLDLLPQELFEDENTKFLDPACKSGVFLREIVKRLNKGLEKKIPGKQERLDYILHNQVFGIAITELTSLLSRRSVYCSKYPNSEFSISHFDNIEGNIRYKIIEHIFENKKCIYCNAGEDIFGKEKRKELESHAYEFIHFDGGDIIKQIQDRFFGGDRNMKFDVIISNPPYQINDGGAQASASPIYQKFIQQAIKLNPKYITMIVPSRWMTGGKGLDDFRYQMLHDNRLAIIHDFKDASNCFTGVEIKGGVNYFLWDRDKKDPLVKIINDNGKEGSNEMVRPLLEENSNVLIRNNNLISIYNKVSKKKERSFSEIVSTRKPYGLTGDFFNGPSKYNLPDISDVEIKGGYTIYGLEFMKRTAKFVDKNYPFPKKGNINKFKVFVSESYGSGEFGEIPAAEIFGKPGDACTETFLEIGPFKNESETKNCISYWKTKFFRALIGAKKNTQHCTKEVYQYIPMQDFTKSWTDEELYKKYDLAKEEIEFIENNVKSMEDK